MLKLYKEIWRRRDLISQLVHGQRRASVHGMRLGSLWHVLVPLSQIMIYYFLVMVIFSSGGGHHSSSFILITMGIMHYAVITGTVGYVQPVVYNNASLLLQVKLEPIVLIAAAYMRALRAVMMGLILFYLCYIVNVDTLSSRILAYPFILGAWLCLGWLLGIVLATLAVYVRDFERLSPVLFQILMYASPVIYATSLFPEKYQPLLLLNPIASIFTLLQWSLLGVNVDTTQPVIVVAVWVVFGWLFAHWYYRRNQPKFTKVL